jgi:hypothetical protein
MNKLYALLAAIGSAAVGLIALFVSGVNAGKNKEKAEQLKKNVEQINVAKKINNEIDRSDTASVRQRLRDEFAKD